MSWERERGMEKMRSDKEGESKERWSGRGEDKGRGERRSHGQISRELITALGCIGDLANPLLVFPLKPTPICLSGSDVKSNLVGASSFKKSVLEKLAQKRKRLSVDGDEGRRSGGDGMSRRNEQCGFEGSSDLPSVFIICLMNCVVLKLRNGWRLRSGESAPLCDCCA
ncbi:hypothetical protein Droror1_Dr00026943 [Drosera rotundifolia]